VESDRRSSAPEAAPAGMLVSPRENGLILEARFSF
jgi:hypothetical protein